MGVALDPGIESVFDRCGVPEAGRITNDFYFVSASVLLNKDTEQREIQFFAVPKTIEVQNNPYLQAVDRSAPYLLELETGALISTEAMGCLQSQNQVMPNRPVVSLGNMAIIGPVYVGIESKIGRRSMVMSPVQKGVTIGENVTIGKHGSVGEGSQIEDHVTIAERPQIAGVKIEKSARIGAYFVAAEGAVVGRAAQIGNQVRMDARAVLESSTQVGSKSTLKSDSKVRFGSVLGENVTVGEWADIGPRSFIGPAAKIGKRVRTGSTVYVLPETVVPADKKIKDRKVVYNKMARRAQGVRPD